MNVQLSIGDLEVAINLWRAREPGSAFSLCRPAAELATCYGELIYRRRQWIWISELTAEQVGALTAVLPRIGVAKS